MQHEVTRTLVKSQPEVWAQCSVAESLERHMSGSFGEIRIMRLEPEHSVAWEGEKVRGTVKIEPSAWGTRVTLAVETEEAAAPSPPLTAAASHEASEPVQTHAPPDPGGSPEPPAEIEGPSAEVPEPVAEAADRDPEPLADADAPRPRRRFGRWWGRFRRQPVPDQEVDTGPEGEFEPIPDPADEELLIQDARQEIARQEIEQPDAAPSEPAPEPAPTPAAEVALSAALESLGQAHHRPFSRA